MNKTTKYALIFGTTAVIIGATVGMTTYAFSKGNKENVATEETTESSDGLDKIAIFCAGDLRYVYPCGNGQYCDKDGNTYDALSNFTTFIRTSDDLTYYSADVMGIDLADWDVVE